MKNKRFVVPGLIVLLYVAVGFIVGALTCRLAQAEPYLQTAGGCIKSSDTSNSDEIEFGGECGGVVLAEGGWRFDQDTFAIDLGLEGGYRFKDLHGRNGEACEQRSCATDATLNVGSLMLNLQLCTTVYGPVTVCSMAGAGGAYAQAFGDDDTTGAWQVGASVGWQISRTWSASAGYRFFKMLDYSLDGNDGSSDFHGVLVGVRYDFVSEPPRAQLGASD